MRKWFHWVRVSTGWQIPSVPSHCFITSTPKTTFLISPYNITTTASSPISNNLLATIPHTIFHTMSAHQVPSNQSEDSSSLASCSAEVFGDVHHVRTDTWNPWRPATGTSRVNDSFSGIPYSVPDVGFSTEQSRRSTPEPHHSVVPLSQNALSAETFRPRALPDKCEVRDGENRNGRAGAERLAHHRLPV